MIHLLPPNASRLERDLEQVAHASFDDLGIDIASLWNPATCPEHLLGWLAWALSVDRWDATWTAQVKRQVIAASPAIHRAKGTRAAVEDALGALFVRARITEWWQPGGSGVAGTFIIRAYARSPIATGEAVLSAMTIAAIRAIVSATAPVSRHFTLEVGVDTQTDIGVAAAVGRVARISEHAGTARCGPDRVAALACGVGIRTARFVEIDMGLAA